jgi:tetratricopeptide (TPR) repeat protein
MVVMLTLLAMGVSAAQTDHARGVELYKAQKYNEAISVLQQAFKAEDPQSAEYRESALLIGQSYFMLSQAPQAIPWLEKVSTINEANYMLGYAYLQAAQLELSEAAFARLFELKPDSAKAHLLAAQMMLKKQYEDQAMMEVNKALALDPKLPQAHFLRGEMYLFGGQLDDGIGELKAELENDPNFAMAWYRLGDAYTRKEDWATAIPDLQRAVWLNPDYSGPYILLGKCYFKQSNFSNADGILRRALKLDPNNESAIYLLGQTLMAEGRQDEGRAELEKLRALKTAPTGFLPR